MNRRRKRQLLWILTPTLLATAMWLWLRSPVPTLDPPTAQALQVAAAQWWQPGGPTRTIAEKDWPLELRRLSPKAVRVTPEGVFIKFGSRLVEEWGLFILPTGSSFQPQQNPDPSFRPIRGRVYRYDIKG